MSEENAPETTVALFGTLATATAALYALQDAGVPYANISMTSHTSDEVAASLGHPIEDDDGQVWALSVLIGEPLHSKALDVLRSQQTFAVGQQAAALAGRDEVERGRTAWGHYVFEPVAASDRVGEAAGTAGTTGIINSGAFASKANAEDNPPAQDGKDQARG